MKLLLLVLASFFGLISGQLNRPGECPPVETLQDFDVEKFIGDWYEIYTAGMEYENGLECITAKYNFKADTNTTIDVTYTGVNEKKITNLKAEATKDDPSSTEAKFSLVFPSINGSEALPYWILNTDYEEYAIVYACAPNGPNRTEYMYVLARTTYIPPNLIGFVYNDVSEFVPWSAIRGISHTPDACDGASAPTVAFFMIVLSAVISKLMY